MEITWLGTASILIKSGNTTLLFDPYLRAYGREDPPFPREVLPQVQAVFITHPHLDHFSDMDRIMKDCAAPVYVCRKGIEIAARQNLDLLRIREIQGGDSLSVQDFSIRIYQSCHCHFDRPVVRQTLKKALQPENFPSALQIEKLNRQYRIDTEKDVLAFEIRAEEKVLFLMGTANLREDICYPKHMDLLIFPYQGRSDMAEYSLRILERLSPRAVLLDHFDDAFPPVSSFVDCAPLISLAGARFPQMKILLPELLKPYSF